MLIAGLERKRGEWRGRGEGREREPYQPSLNRLMGLKRQGVGACAALGPVALAAHTINKQIIDYAMFIFGAFSTTAQSLIASSLGKVWRSPSPPPCHPPPYPRCILPLLPPLEGPEGPSCTCNLYWLVKLPQPTNCCDINRMHQLGQAGSEYVACEIDENQL